MLSERRSEQQFQALLPVSVTRYKAGQFAATKESVIEELPVAIVYNGTPHVVMMASPVDLEDFLLGFSLTEELISQPSDLRNLVIDHFGSGVEINATVSDSCMAGITERTRRLTGRSGCGICGVDSIAAVVRSTRSISSTVSIAAPAITRAFEELSQCQKLNRASGAVHAAGWADLNGRISHAKEDVGRHNALDKLVGAVTRAGDDPAQGFVVVTSRASFEMVQKTMMLGSPLIAAISGPTGLAIQLAEEAGLTLIGFAREDRLTIYSHPERVVL